MCYLGIGDTYTAVHKDSSASTGYNLMVHTSSITEPAAGAAEHDDDALLESNGDASAFWFLTAAEDASPVSEFFLKKLGQVLDFQAHYATIPELTEGDFKVSLGVFRHNDIGAHVCIRSMFVNRNWEIWSLYRDNRVIKSA